MKNAQLYFLLICLIGFITTKNPIQAQQTLTHNRYIIYFSDKLNNSYSINDSATFLSARALQRRQNQQIHISASDIPITQSYLDSVTATGAIILQKSKWFNYVCVEISDSSQLAAITQLPFVVSNKLVNRISNHEKMVFTDKFSVENETSALLSASASSSNSTNLNYGNSYNQIHQIGGDVLHSLNYRGQGMQIAVFDAGFPNVNNLQAFDSLNNDGRLLGYRNFVQNNNNVFAASLNQHGTSTLSCMAAYKDGQLIGTAPKASYYLFITEDVSSETPYEEVCWNSAAELADSLGVDIISSSLGYTNFNYGPQSYTHASMNGDIAISTRAADMAASKGILVVNSAGNEGASAWQKIAAPSDGDSVLSVGAVDNMGVRASFSSKGNTADGRIKPDVCAQGVGAVLANSGGGFYGGNGTSFSCPIIAGMAACLWQYFPNITNMQLLEIIRQYSSQFNTPDSLLGYGIPNFSLAVQEIVSSALIKDDPIKSVFPTKFSNHINIIFHNSDTETISTKLINVHGEIIVERSFSTISNNNNLLSIDQLDVAQGMYTLVIQSRKQMLYRKVVCVK